MRTTSPAEENAHRALMDAGLQGSLVRGTPSPQAERTAAAMGPPGFERPRDTGRESDGREIETHTLARLGSSLGHGAETVERAGGTVHRCGTAGEDSGPVSETRREAGARTVTEDKAPTGEEAGSTGRPERYRMTSVETDPGEYSIQLRREHPGHRPHAGRCERMTGGLVLVAGPSRSAGIEPTLEPGARSPCRLHVVLVEDDPAAPTPEGHA